MCSLYHAYKERKIPLFMEDAHWCVKGGNVTITVSYLQEVQHKQESVCMFVCLYTDTDIKQKWNYQLLSLDDEHTVCLLFFFLLPCTCGDGEHKMCPSSQKVESSCF